MVKYKNLYIIGTSHISKQSVNEVKRTIEKLNPEIIALELDQSRFLALTSNKKQDSKITTKIQMLGIKGFLFNSIGAFVEKSLGKRTGIKPGTEMKTAIDLAKKNKIEIALIDQPITITIKKLTSQITKKEKIFFIKELLQTLFAKQKHLPFNLNKVPSQKTIDKLIEETKYNYPTIYRVLVEERNVYMANALNKLMNTYPKKTILAIIGAGHEKEIVGEIKSIKN